MALAVRSPSPYRCTDARRIFWVDPVHVERDVIADGSSSGETQSFFHHCTHSAFVDIAHRECMNTGTLDVVTFVRVHIADAHQHTVVGLYFWTKSENIAQWRIEQTHNRTQRHTMHVPAGRGFGRVDIAVGVNPDEADLLVLAAV